MNELVELNRDLDELSDNEGKNKERQSDSDNSGEVEWVSVGIKMIYKSLNETSSLIEKNYNLISPPDVEENCERNELTN